MSTLEKTLLSDLDEDDGLNKVANGVSVQFVGNGDGDNEVTDGSSVFKSFFTSDNADHHLEAQTESLSQSGHFDEKTLSQALNYDSSNSDVAVYDNKGQALNDDSFKSDVAVYDNNKGGTSLARINETKVLDELSSDSPHHNGVSMHRSSVKNYQQCNLDEHKVPDSEHVNDNKERLSSSNSTVSNETDSDCKLFGVCETNAPRNDSNPICEDRRNLESVEGTTVVESTCAQYITHTAQESPSSKKHLIAADSSELCTLYHYNDRSEKENGTMDMDKSSYSTDQAGINDSYIFGEDKVTADDCACERRPLCKRAENATTSNSEPKKIDPFTLSGDEDFSPKAYKPIKRKFNQGLADATSHKMDLFDEESDEKRLKLLQEEDLSLSDMSGRKTVNVAYVYSKELIDKANRLIRIEGRANLVHSLIEVYGILNHVEVIPPRLATDTEILGFHSSEYIDFLRKLADGDDLSDSTNAEAEAYGLSYDCPVQEGVFQTASLISGATISAAESLISGTASIAINWCGGWHHAKRDSASGFCYINDIVLGILKLREKFDRVLYVDLDLHHGDGVEEAFYLTPKVMTVSFHKYAFGFFPGSGSIDDIGSGRGKLHSVNVPLMDGIGDVQFFSVFTSVMKKIREKFKPEAIVVQCGADALSGDPMASFNLSHLAIAKCVCLMLTWNLPTLLLGGGGYNFPNTAKCWTFLTAMAAGKKLPVDIPEHEHLMEYGPSFELTTSQGNRKDCNTKEHFYQTMAKICKNLNCL